MSDHLGVLSPQSGPWADGGEGTPARVRGGAEEKEQLEEEKRKRSGRGRGRGRPQEVSRFFAGNFALAGTAPGARPVAAPPACQLLLFLLQPPPRSETSRPGDSDSPYERTTPSPTHPPISLGVRSLCPTPTPHPPGRDPKLQKLR